MGGPRNDRILALASMAFALLLAVPPCALAQDASKPDATFNERYPAEQTPAQGAPEQTVGQPAPEIAPRMTPRWRCERKVEVYLNGHCRCVETGIVIIRVHAGDEFPHDPEVFEVDFW
jgi:hypothetical protein